MRSIMKTDEQGNKRWYLNGKLHRDNDLPAAEYSNGDKHWWTHGQRHRENGPATEDVNGNKEWWLNGVKAPWLEESLKIKAHLDDTLSKKECTQSK